MSGNLSTRRCVVVASAMLATQTAWLVGQVPAKPSAAVSSLPSSQPTGAQPGSAQSAPETGSKQPSQHLDVSYNDGQLTVDATNASLNNILREVSRKTGIKVTGGVEDDRVFGHYGPSSPAVVLDALLDGTGSNVLLVAPPETEPGHARPEATAGSGVGSLAGSELILTPRRGGVSPPNTGMSAQSADPDSGAGQYVAPARPYQLPIANGRNVGAAPSNDGTQSPGGDGTDSSAPKTPQQIYDQLQRTMQRQQQTPQATPQ